MQKKEILFLWDGENWNPNGDMLKDNAPRRDDETGVAEVTDVRIKRTIRDEIMKKDEASIFIKEYRIEDALLDAKTAIRQSINISKAKANYKEKFCLNLSISAHLAEFCLFQIKTR